MSNPSGESPQLHCDACLKGKQHQNVIPAESTTRSPGVLYRTYSDVCGPMETTARTGHRYFVTFIDAKDYFTRSEVETGERPNTFRSDGGGEYCSQEFSAYLKSKGIHHEKTNAYTPQENGVAERMNRTLVETARAMLHDAHK